MHLVDFSEMIREKSRVRTSLQMERLAVFVPYIVPLWARSARIAGSSSRLHYVAPHQLLAVLAELASCDFQTNMFWNL